MCPLEADGEGGPATTTVGVRRLEEERVPEEGERDGDDEDRYNAEGKKNKNQVYYKQKNTLNY